MMHTPLLPPHEIEPPAERPLTDAENAALTHAFDGLKAALASQQTPRRVAQTLQWAMRERIETTRRQRWQSRVAHWFAPGLGLAASVGMAAWITLLPQPLATVTPPSAFIDTPFIALGPLESIAIEARPRLIQTEVPRMWLAEFGVAVNPETANEKIHAEMLIGAAGQPLAVRFAP
jgi:hypothetical protein